MGLLEGNERRHLVELFLKLPQIGDPNLRNILLANLPGTLKNTLASNEAGAIIFVPQLIDTVDGETWAQLLDGSWSVIYVIENAISLIRGAHLEGDLQVLLATLQTRATARRADHPQPIVSTAQSAISPDEPRILLTEAQRLYLQEAILSAFPKKAKLSQWVWETFDENLMTLAGDTTLIIVTRNLITWAEASDRIGNMVDALLEIDPNNSELRAIVAPVGSHS